MSRLNPRHLWILLLTTLVIQGVMYISYPFGTSNNNDDEAAQAFLLDEVASGNLMIGNVRYNTGYAFVMAPLKSLTKTLGRLDDRTFLLLQMSLYSTIPFMVYDILRRRFDSRTALITALIVLVDPIGLQWAHFRLPGWLIATVTVWALWLAQLAWSATIGRRIALVALAAVGLGMMTIARLNFAPVAAVFGFSFLLWRHIHFRQRAGLFALVGFVSAGVLCLYMLLIHIPSTGTTQLSCTTGTTLVSALNEKQIPVLASNGPRSSHYADLLTLETDRATDFYADTYPLWRNPGPWVSGAEAEAFFDQPIGQAEEEIVTRFSAELYWYLGPCAADALLEDVYYEAIAKAPIKLLFEIIKSIFHMLIQDPTSLVFPIQYLDQPEEIIWKGDGSFGFFNADSAAYNGHRIWRPGVHLYSGLNSKAVDFLCFK